MESALPAGQLRRHPWQAREIPPDFDGYVMAQGYDAKNLTAPLAVGDCISCTSLSYIEGSGGPGPDGEECGAELR